MAYNGITSTTSQLQSMSVQNQILKHINKKLAAGKKKKKGIVELKSFLNECSDIIFTENCVKWMQYCCMVDITDPESTFIRLQVLRDLTKSAVRFPELGKPISNSVIPRFTDVFIKHLSKYEEAWKTFESLLWSYNGPFGPNKEALTALMKTRMADEKIRMFEAKCYALLPSAGGGGTKGATHKANWNAQFIFVIASSHDILNQLFKDIQELQVYDVESTVDNIPFTDLVIHLHNHSLLLRAMLLGRYPVAKNILPEKVLDLVCRGLLVTGMYLGEAELATTADLRAAIPIIHVNLLKILSALVVACSRTLLPYAGVIARLIKQSLQSTPSADVRLACYSCLSNWLVVAGSGSYMETLAKILLPTLLGDIEYARPVISLIDSNKKVDSSVRILLTDSEYSESLCFAALEVLQAYLSAVGFLLSPEMHKTIQEAVIRLLTILQKRCSSGEPIYGRYERCRRGLYSVLLHLCLEPNPKWAPPTQFAAKLFSVGREDSSPLVAATCNTALSVLDRIIHPEFRVASFPVDYQTALRSELEGSVQLVPRYQPERCVPTSVTFFRQFMDKLSVPTVANSDSASEPPPEPTSSLNVNNGSASSNDHSVNGEIDCVIAEPVSEGNQEDFSNGNGITDQQQEASQMSKNDNAFVTDHVDDICVEDGEPDGDASNEHDILENAPAKKRKLNPVILITPLLETPASSQESVASDVSSLPCSQMPKKPLYFPEESNLGCSQAQSEDHLELEDLSNRGSSQQLSQMEVILEEPEKTSLAVKPVNSQVEKVKGVSAEKTPERKYQTRSKGSQDGIDSPMTLRSGVSLASPSSVLERRTRRRAGSISSSASQGSRCQGAPGSPRSDIGDGDIDIIADFEDTLKGDD